MIENIEYKKEYRDNINKKLQDLTGREGKIANKLYEYEICEYGEKYTIKRELEYILVENSPKNTEELFMDGPYGVIEAATDKKTAELVLKVALRFNKHIFSMSMYRRSFRTDDVYAYVEKIVYLLGYVYVIPDGYNVLKYLKSQPDKTGDPFINNYLYRGNFISDLLAVEIDEGNTAVIEEVKNVCLGENNTRLLNDSIISGIFKSNSKELHKLMCDLLLAAKLQEGLRQSILEAADSGCIEAFIMVLKTIVENNLIRYSSVVRAVDVWMGLGESADDGRKRVTEKLLNLAYSYLTDEVSRKNAESSKDVIELYVSLWASAVYEVKNISPFIDRLMRGEKYQKLVAMYFVSNVNFPEYKYEISAKYLHERDLDILACILHNIIGYDSFYMYVNEDKNDFLKRVKKETNLKDKDLRDSLFSKLINILPQIPQTAGYTVDEKPFEWNRIHITRNSLFKIMFCINAYEDNKYNDILLKLMNLADSECRLMFIKFFADGSHNTDERNFIFESLSDKSMSVRAEALKLIKELKLNESEEQLIMNLLSLKTGEIRQLSVTILLGLPQKRILYILKGLLSDKNENKRLGGLDILMNMVKDKSITSQEALEYTSLMPKITDREKVLVDSLNIVESKYSYENGFLLYDKKYAQKMNIALPEYKYKLKDIFNFSVTRMEKIFDSLAELIHENRDYEFTANLPSYFSEHAKDQTLGTARNFYWMRGKDNGNPTVDDFVLPEVWRKWLKDNNVSLEELLILNFSQYVRSYSYYDRKYYPWVSELMEKLFNTKDISEVVNYYSPKNYATAALFIMNLLIEEFPKQDKFEMLCGCLSDLIDSVSEEKWKTAVEENIHAQNRPYLLVDTKEVNFLLNSVRNLCGDDERFKIYVMFCFKLGGLSGFICYGMEYTDMGRAYTLGVVPKDALFQILFNSDGNEISSFAGKTFHKYQKFSAEKYPVIVEVATEAASRIIEIELGRGDSKTEVSHLAQRIRYHEGAENFANILISLGDEAFERGYSYYSSDTTKKHVLSCLLKASHPSENDDEETLKKALDGKVNEKRLLEAAMYSPPWLNIVSKYLKWDGLESAAWYFHAHINEYFSAEKETQVARYSPISPQEFNDGAFDINWFNEAYKTLGKERFEILYDCAKYLTSGANHRRAQIFADASLGKIKITTLEKEIKDKRNKDKLLAYSLIPLKKNAEKDLLKRYEFIQGFLKESKKFGAQRRESEGKACAISLDNLARTAGFRDALRFTWRMETLKIEEISRFFIPKELEGIKVFIEINDLGLAALVCQKENKRLNSVPAKIKKDAYIMECKKVVTSLKDQQKRAKASLENAMIRSDVFTYKELTDLMNHPVISPLIKNLLFINGAHVDIYDGFTDVEDNSELRIAHSYDLYSTKTWIEWQRYAFENKVIQPFKQIFRELYIPNEDELREKTISRRYAGHQVQVRKTSAMLKTRGWTVDGENGLQKVYYKENIIATMYAAADWFSPADVEEPVLETVVFFDRKTYKPILFTEIPPIVFSEVMRDIDMVVSIAHVGGVDPEASHSTVEMRASIVRELLALLKITNAEIKERHVIVKGSLGEYAVHLGSGVVHMTGRGAINILAVQSQHRGRVFLPFADEDPRTAEIMSKILLLSNDKDIKDTAILAQIK